MTRMWGLELSEDLVLTMSGCQQVNQIPTHGLSVGSGLKPGSRASDLKRHIIYYELTLEVRHITFAMFCSLKESQ